MPYELSDFFMPMVRPLIPSTALVHDILLIVLCMNVTNVALSSHFHKAQGDNRTGCDLFSGTWVLDGSYPLYQSSSCSVIDQEFNCKMFGRPDSEYQKYRWKPIECELPRQEYLLMLPYNLFSS